MSLKIGLHIVPFRLLSNLTFMMLSFINLKNPYRLIRVGAIPPDSSVYPTKARFMQRFR